MSFPLHFHSQKPKYGFDKYGLYISDMSFARKILNWDRLQEVRYPWVGEKNPYRILLSEFLLQQTRSDQAVGYYRRMLDAFPDIVALAEAEEDEILRQWQGLGYYSRARNLHKAAKKIVREYDGQIPNTYAKLQTLPGIGPYTAAAIASFAFGESQPVVDGNVYRVLSRCYEIDTPINTGRAHVEFVEKAKQLLGRSNPAKFNQAIMNLGAHVCLPKNPLCNQCPVRSICASFENESQQLFPVKKKPKPRRERYFHYLDIRIQRHFIIEKRGEQDIWKGLYQFPLIETESFDTLSPTELATFIESNFPSSSFDLMSSTATYKQTLSHQVIHSRFYQISLRRQPKSEERNFALVFHKNLKNFAFPKTITQYFESI